MPMTMVKSPISAWPSWPRKQLGYFCWMHALLLVMQKSLALPSVPSFSDCTRHHHHPVRLHRPKKMSDASRLLRMESSLISSSSSSSSSPSPWSPGMWKMTLIFDKDNNSQTPKAEDNRLDSRGGKLALSFQVIVSAETNTIENNKLKAWLGGKSMGSLKCVSQSLKNNNDDETDYCASYINENGQQNVEISSGQWRIEPPLPLLPSYAKIISGQASTLRFFFTITTPISRNSISFPGNQLLLMQSNAFRTNQYKKGIKSLLPYQYAKENAQKLLDDQLNHDTGDRRLDGSDILETLEGYRDIARLVMNRDATKRKWGEIERVLPRIGVKQSTNEVDVENLMKDKDRWGIWPGDTELITLERGSIFALTSESQKKVGIFSWIENGGGESLVEVGKWIATPI